MHPPRLDRRRFLQTSAAALGLAASGGLHPSLACAEDKKDDPFGGFTLGVQSYTFRNFDLEPALKRTRDLGLHHVEFFQKHAPLDSSPAKIKAIRKLCKEYDVTPVAYGVQGFTKDHDANKKVFEFAKQLGVKSLSADPTPDSFDSLDKLCAEYKIAIAIHPHGPIGKGQRHRWWSAETILKAVKDHHPLIGSCLDTGHLIRMAQLGVLLDPAKEVLVMGKRNFGLHLKDHNNKKHTDVVYGKDGGVLDVPAVLKALRQVGFQGSISIEYEANPQEPTADVRQCVAIFKESVKKLG
ncbi:MAG TPA: sugar phosphate isomerase/epimerase [Gemmataceae bacterium]|nr:sugar phosphate isomerase/epimerase [Gemmataceae bacterium]